MKPQAGNVSGWDNGLAVTETSSGYYAIGREEYLSFANRMEHVMLSKYWN